MFCKVNKLFTMKMTMLEGDAILLENLTLDRHGGIWHLLDEELLARLIPKIGLREELCICVKAFFFIQVLERKVGTIFDGLRQLKMHSVAAR